MHQVGKHARFGLHVVASKNNLKVQAVNKLLKSCERCNINNRSFVLMRETSILAPSTKFDLI